jgi:hypothetical protein
MKTKNEFMLVFRYEPNSSHEPTVAELDEMQQQWGAFIGNIAIKEKLVSTHQLGFEGVQITARKRTKKGIHIAEKQTLGGNLIVRVNSIKEAVEISKNCPILNMGGSVEVRNILPM